MRHELIFPWPEIIEAPGAMVLVKVPVRELLVNVETPLELKFVQVDVLATTTRFPKLDVVLVTPLPFPAIGA